MAFVLLLNTNFTIQALFTIADSYLTLHDYTKKLHPKLVKRKNYSKGYAESL